MWRDSQKSICAGHLHPPSQCCIHPLPYPDPSTACAFPPNTAPSLPSYQPIRPSLTLHPPFTLPDVSTDSSLPNTAPSLNLSTVCALPTTALTHPNPTFQPISPHCTPPPTQNRPVDRFSPTKTSTGAAPRPRARTIPRRPTAPGAAKPCPRWRRPGVPSRLLPTTVRHLPVHGPGLFCTRGAHVQARQQAYRGQRGAASTDPGVRRELGVRERAGVVAGRGGREAQRVGGLEGGDRAAGVREVAAGLLCGVCRKHHRPRYGDDQ